MMKVIQLRRIAECNSFEFQRRNALAIEHDLVFYGSKIEKNIRRRDFVERHLDPVEYRFISNRDLRMTKR